MLSPSHLENHSNPDRKDTSSVDNETNPPAADSQSADQIDELNDAMQGLSESFTDIADDVIVGSTVMVQPPNDVNAQHQEESFTDIADEVIVGRTIMVQPPKDDNVQQQEENAIISNEQEEKQTILCPTTEKQTLSVDNEKTPPAADIQNADQIDELNDAMKGLSESFTGIADEVIVGKTVMVQPPNDVDVQQKEENVIISNDRGQEQTDAQDKISHLLKLSGSANMPLKSTQCFGGGGGGPFDHGHNCQKPIIAISVIAGNIVDGIRVTYDDGGYPIVKYHGGRGGNEEFISLSKGEYITEINVRHNTTIVQRLTFKTNKGRQLGPCGGEGLWLRFGGNKNGMETIVLAPKGYMLSGIKGGSGVYLDSIGFHWSPISQRSDD